MTAVAPSNRNPADRNADATIHIAQLDDKVTDAVLWELMVQAAPVRHVYIPRDRITGKHFGYGFCEFRTSLDAAYASKVLNMVKLFSKPIRISQSTVDRRSQDVGANLFVGNLVDEVDEKLLHDAFSAFGPIVDAPYIMRDPLTNESKRYAFVKFATFEAADAAIAAMDGQYICNAPISVQYAFKKDGQSRERHGSQAERILALRAAEANTPANKHKLVPHTLFADRPASARAQPNHAQPPVPPHQPAPQPHQIPIPHHPQPGYHYPPQQYPPHPAAPIPQWQRNAYVQPQYNGMPPHSYHYQQAPLPHQSYPAYQGPPAPHLGWTQNRQYGSVGANAAYSPAQPQQYQGTQPPGSALPAHPAQTAVPPSSNQLQDSPRLVADEGAPPPPPTTGS